MKYKSKTFKIVTLGCKVNQYESAYLEEALQQAGWNTVSAGKPADVVVLNTCIVTRRAAHQSRQAIRKAIRDNPAAMVAATGCYAQVFADELSRIKGLSLIAGNNYKRELPDLLRRRTPGDKPLLLQEGFSCGHPFEDLEFKRFADRTRAYLKIQDGCESYCSYCIVPSARGPYRSLPASTVLDRLESFATESYKEIVLTGIHLGKYGYDLDGKDSLNRLLQAVGREQFPFRVRLSSLEPGEISLELIDLLASEPWLCRHLHIPLQSGDKRVLKRMNRLYSPQEFARLVGSIRERIPLAAVGVDIMAGFPGEDARAHGNTVSLIDDLPVSYLHVFPFSPREGTPAADFDRQNDPPTIKLRAAEIRRIGRRKKKEFYRSCLGKSFMVLPEARDPEQPGVMKGTSDNYLPVLFAPAEAAIDEPVHLRMERIERDRLIAAS